TARTTGSWAGVASNVRQVGASDSSTAPTCSGLGGLKPSSSIATALVMVGSLRERPSWNPNRTASAVCGILLLERSNRKANAGEGGQWRKGKKRGNPDRFSHAMPPPRLLEGASSWQMFHPPGKSATTPMTVRLSRAVQGHLAVLCSCPLRQL